MIRDGVGRYSDRILGELRETFAEAHTPRETAASFAIGTFITMLPTLGVGLFVFVVIAYLSDRINTVALFASVVVFNPAVKWGVYVASFALGVLVLGPVEGVGLADVSLDAGPDIVSRLLVGNALLAIAATAISYVVVHRLARAYRASEVREIIDEAIEETVEEVIEQ